MIGIFSSISGTSALLLFARLAGAGIGIILQIMIARFYGAQVLGNYYLALSLAAVFSIALTLGYPWTVAPIVARSQAEDNPGLLRRFLYSARKDMITASLLLAIPAALIIWLIPNIVEEQRYALLIGVATAPIYAAMRLSGGLANAFKYFQTANLPELLLRPFFLLCIIATCLSLAIPLSTVAIVAINLVITAALAIWMASQLPKQTKFSICQLFKGEQISTEQSSNWRKLAIPMIFATLFVNLFADLDILMIGTILPAKEAGIFGVCIKIASLFAFTVQIVHQILLRDASDAHLASDVNALKATIRSANFFAVSTSVLAFALMLFFGNWVLGIFGAEFTEGYYAILGLMFAQLIRAIAGPAIQILMITGNQRAGVPVYAVSIVLLFIYNIAFVPTFGFEGAAAAVICTTLFWTVWLNVIVKRKLGMSVSIFGSLLA